MNIKDQKGFSLVEMIVVCTIVGIIAAIAIPYLRKAVHASQNNNVYASLKSAASTQMSFYGSNKRYANLTELNNEMGGALGNPDGNDIVRGNFRITMAVPNQNPTPAELSQGEYEIIATRQLGDGALPYIATIDQTGRVTDNFFDQN